MADQATEQQAAYWLKGSVVVGWPCAGKSQVRTPLPLCRPAIAHSLPTAVHASRPVLANGTFTCSHLSPSRLRPRPRESAEAAAFSPGSPQTLTADPPRHQAHEHSIRERQDSSHCRRLGPRRDKGSTPSQSRPSLCSRLEGPYALRTMMQKLWIAVAADVGTSLVVTLNGMRLALAGRGRSEIASRSEAREMGRRVTGSP